MFPFSASVSLAAVVPEGAPQGENRPRHREYSPISSKESNVSTVHVVNIRGSGEGRVVVVKGVRPLGPGGHGTCMA